jgi:hypothetical protein
MRDKRKLQAEGTTCTKALRFHRGQFSGKQEDLSISRRSESRRSNEVMKLERSTELDCMLHHSG